MKRNENATCANCPYMEPAGLCHKHPPINVDGWAAWMAVYPSWWCADHPDFWGSSVERIDTICAGGEHHAR